jgi:glycosyltransferase involved in cell wall biosynthesis
MHEGQPATCSPQMTKDTFDGVLCFGGVDWWYHNRAHSDVQIMSQLSKKLPVLFINSLGMRTPTPGKSTQPCRRILRKLGSIARGLRKVAPGMWVFSPLMLPPTSRRWVRRLNGRLIAAQIRLVLKIIGIRRWFTWVTIPTAYDVLQALPNSITIFNRSDKHSTFPEACEEFIKSCESKLLSNSDLILYVNRKLMAEDVGYEDRKYYLGHGVDYHLFARASGNQKKIHPELACLKRPIVGFFGAIEDFVVDLELLKFAAEALPEMSFVLIGLSTSDISDITSLPNVHYFGFRPYHDIPEFGASFDVGIMPWVQSEWIEYCNPVKLKEYLALGIPIVTTPIPQVEEYPGLLSVAKTPQEFVEAIRASVKLNNGRARLLRQKSVEKDSWGCKASEVLKIVRDIAANKSISNQ